MKMKITEVTEVTEVTDCDSKAMESSATVAKPAKSYTICLNMIVKNESHIIEKTLENLCRYVAFDAYYISDTGSTDNTMDLIRAFFKARGIPGEIEQVEWRDFGFNRTLALQMAFKKTDYLFIFDADDSIHGNFVLPRELTHDAYQLKLGQSFVYLRTLIVNNRKRWRFVGVLHEYITCVDKEESSHAVQGDYYVESGRSGSRNQDPQKYIKDATVLEHGYNEEIRNAGSNGNGTGDRALAERYAFYCAQSWMDAGPAHIESSIEWYERVLTQNNWSQEKYYSALCLGNLYYKKGDKYNAFKYYSKTIEYDEERIEGVAAMMEILRADGNHVIVNALYQKFKNYNRAPQNKLFLAMDKYEDVIEYNNSISAFYISDKRSGYDCCKTILHHSIMAYHFMTSTYSNLVFYRQFFEDETFPESLRLFFSVNHFLSVVASKSDTYSDDDFETWTRLFNKIRPALVAPAHLQKTEDEYLPGSTAETVIPEDEYSNKKTVITKFHLKRVSEHYATAAAATAPSVVVNRNRTAHARVIITFTTCKRLDLFQQTVNSILNMWNDIHMIDYWYCVDDNSSEDDREQMRKAYPWIDFYMKGEAEKGHRASMNIIWNKLTDTRPEYWIHMEDDFLFHTPGSYVAKATQMMVDSRNAGYNVRQVLYNRNYGETINDYKMQGHRILRNMTHDVALHQHKNGDFPYGNCHYWPHYSFRPSMIDVNAILILGNYDSANQFFEMDYAKRWQSLGFMSGFYNQITNRHIGRLTSERGDKSQPNAYELNDENQFVAKTTDELAAATAAATPATKPITATGFEVAAPKKRYYSTIPFDDGFGAQFQRFIWTCIYAEECEQSTFVYRSPEKMAHNYDADPKFIEKMEDIMNIKPYYMNYRDALKLVDSNGDGDGVQILTPDFYDIFNYVERNIDMCMKSESMMRLKRRFWENKNRAAVYAGFSKNNEYTLHLAAHIRRPNCDDTRPNSGEEYTDKYYIKTLSTIRDKYAKSRPNDRIMIHIYSQGGADKFANFIGNKVIGKDVVLHLNDTNEETYLGMAAADILITSASSFSYSAAFFSDGDIYYTEFWHKPCSWWNLLEKV
jgi:tetratricopeptide (TPR) repeat protein